MTENHILTAALDYAERDIPVFPCHPETKRPLTPAESSPGAKDGGLYVATCDRNQIEQWWKRFPKALIGAPTGLKSRSFVIDLDPREFSASDMLSALSDWCDGMLSEPDRATGEIIEPPVVRTQSGGLHLWYSDPTLAGDEKVGNRANLFKDIESAPEAISRYVDVRGEGGYVILPPSQMANGNVYSWERKGDFPQATRKLLDVILRRGDYARDAVVQSQNQPVPSVDETIHENIRKYALSALDREIREVSSSVKGGRNDRLNNAAVALGSLVGAGVLSESMVQSGLEDAAVRCGLMQSDGLKSVKDTIRSGLTFGKANPRDLSQIEKNARERAGRRSSYHSSARLSAPEPETRFSDEIPEPSDDADTSDDRPSTLGSDDVDLKIVEGCVGLDHSDTDNAERLIRHFGQDLTVLAQDGVPGGDWLAWTGTHWDLSGGASRVRLIAQKLGFRIGLEADFFDYSPDEKAILEAQTDEKEVKKVIEALEKRKKARRSHAVTSKNHARMEKALECAAPRLRRNPDEYNADRMRVATKTHTLCFVKTPDPECPDPDSERYTVSVDALSAHFREDWITAVLPVEWNGMDAKAEKWLRFLAEMLPDEAKRRTVQQFSGVGLLGIPLQFVMFHYGLGANGKSVFLETLSRIFGPGLSVGLPRESIVGSGDRSAGSASPDLVRLYGKKMVRILEVKGDVPLQEDLIKRLTGGEAFPVRTLFKGYFEFQNFAAAHMSGNNFPTIDGTDNGIWRRLLVVHWDQVIPEDKRRDFEEVVSEFINEEGPGILAWLVKGALDFLQNGLVIAESVQQDTSGYREEMDPIGEFVKACVVKKDGARVQAHMMYEAYKSWSEANAKRPRSNTRFGRTMGQQFRKQESNGRIYYMDCDLQNVPDRPDNHPETRF